eukprot:4133750-Pyramimonas_sp.AAC.1
MFLGAGRNRGHTSGKGKGRRGNPKDANGKTMECDIFHSTQQFRRECPRGDGRGRGPSIHLAQTDSDMQCVDWEYLCASMNLDNCADELFEEVFTGHNDIDLAEWL